MLRRRGVEVHTHATMDEATDQGVLLSSGERVPTRTLLWCVGVRADPLIESLDIEVDGGRVVGIVPADVPFSCSCPDKPLPPIVVTPDTIFAIACADAEAARGDDTAEDLEEHFWEMGRGTEFADQWPFRAACS